MTDLVWPPALLMLIGALLISVLRGRWQALLILATPLCTLWAIWQLGDGVLQSAPFLGYSLELVEADRVRRLFATIFALMAFAGGLYALRQASWYELSAAYAYAGGAIGVCFAGDLISFFLFWELMALCSTLVIWSAGGDAARRAGLRYAALHLLGGVLLKLGIVGLILHSGSIDLRPLVLAGWDSWLILLGILINAAAPPLAAWISDAYPEASPSGSVFLSAFTTKAAVLALILMFPGTQLLIVVGLVMIFYGIIYALLENDMRRILAYSIVNQVGFMLVGIGIGTEMALNGAAAHAFAHIIYKGLLFMTAGAVLMQTGKRRCSELGGLYQSMPLTTICAIVGALAISSFPFTSGFISKSMIAQGAADQHLALVWYLLTAASAGVFLHAGIKFPWFVFFQKDSGMRPAEPPWNMRAAMLLMAFACIAIGCAPSALYALLPYPVAYVPYTAGHVITQLQLLLFAGLAFFVMLPWMKRTLTISLDADWLYRVLVPALLHAWLRLWRHIDDAIDGALGRLSTLWQRLVVAPHRPSGWIVASWTTGAMALGVLLALALLIWRHLI